MPAKIARPRWTAAASAKYSSALLGGSLAGPHENRMKGSKHIRSIAFNICMSNQTPEVNINASLTINKVPNVVFKKVKATTCCNLEPVNFLPDGLLIPNFCSKRDKIFYLLS